MRVLELFSGTHSVGNVAKQRGYEVVSLDTDGRANITEDILTWDYTTYKPGHFDIVWASPPCTRYSIMNNIKANNFKNVNKDLTESNMIVQQTLQIIDYLKPKIWFLENPQTGKLKEQSFMLGLPYYDVDYCQYGHNLRKRTRIWTNLKDFTPLMCHKDCDKIVNGKHGSWGQLNEIGIKRLDLRHSIPSRLIDALFDCVLIDAQ